MRKRYKNADEGVVLVAIQIAVDSDLSTERTVPPCSTHVQPDDVSRALIQQGERERLGKTPYSSSTTAWWWSSGSLAGLRQAQTEEERCWRGGGCALDVVRLPSLSLTIYRGKGGGGGTLGFPRVGAAATGETLDGFGRPHPLGNLPPKPGGAATLGVPPPPLLVT